MSIQLFVFMPTKCNWNGNELKNSEQWKKRLIFKLQGDLVYANYARATDFEQLQTELGVNCSGKIVIARYGKGFRGEKVCYSSIFVYVYNQFII